LTVFSVGQNCCNYEGCVQGCLGPGQGQGQIISDQGHVRLWNPTWLVRLHRSYVVEEKRQLKVFTAQT